MTVELLFRSSLRMIDVTLDVALSAPDKLRLVQWCCELASEISCAMDVQFAARP